MRRYRDAFFAALADDFNTRGRWRRCSSGSARPTAASEPVGRADLVEMLTVLGLENLAEAGDARPGAARSSSCSSAARRRAPAKDCAEADRLRDELAGAGWEVRDGPAGPELVRAEP